MGSSEGNLQAHPARHPASGLLGRPPPNQACAEEGPHCQPSLDVDPGWLVPCVTCSPGLDLKVGMDVGRLFGVCKACVGCWPSLQPGENVTPSTGELRLRSTGHSEPAAHWWQNSPLDIGFPDSQLTSKYSDGADF